MSLLVSSSCMVHDNGRIVCGNQQSTPKMVRYLRLTRTIGDDYMNERELAAYNGSHSTPYSSNPPKIEYVFVKKDGWLSRAL
jgi:hypothetical protein